MDVVAFSHLRWDFVYQRPQHLLSRAARDGRILFIEEEVRHDGQARAELSRAAHNVTVCRPLVPAALGAQEAEEVVRDLVARAVRGWAKGPYAVWHYAVMAEPLSRDLTPAVTVFDCMDDLASFRFAPPGLADREARLLERADIVFTGGHSLYEAKRHRHPNVYAFPSSVDVAHFARARTEIAEPALLAGIPRPRLVYAGVIDERLDLSLIQYLGRVAVADVVLIGPTAKVAPEELPRGARLHYLGMQPYEALPAFFAQCDVGVMPFALNEATRCISPTKTPEYLAAGLPVVTTAIADVVHDYGHLRTVHVARAPADFAAACLDALAGPRTAPEVDELLGRSSWDFTWAQMSALMAEAAAGWPDKAA
jgi:UDP-galactopyranose mutase